MHAIIDCCFDCAPHVHRYRDPIANARAIENSFER